MKIEKFIHSCLLIEDGGKRLLADPGMFSFIEKKISPKDIGPVDVILLTHKHADHYYPEALKEFCKMKATKIIANQELSDLLEKEGLKCETIKENENKEIGGFTIQAFEAPHEKLPLEVPHNLAFLVNKKMLVPGDSFSVRDLKSAEVLALPVAGPWARLSDAIDFALQMKPKIVIPVHDGTVKEFFLDRMYKNFCAPVFEKNNIIFKPLGLGEFLGV